MKQQDGLPSSEQLGCSIVGRVFVERAAVTFEHTAESLVGPPRNLGELVVGGAPRS